MYKYTYISARGVAETCMTFCSSTGPLLRLLSLFLRSCVLHYAPLRSCRNLENRNSTNFILKSNSEENFGRFGRYSILGNSDLFTHCVLLVAWKGVSGADTAAGNKLFAMAFLWNIQVVLYVYNRPVFPVCSLEHYASFSNRLKDGCLLRWRAHTDAQKDTPRTRKHTCILCYSILRQYHRIVLVPL